MSKEHLYREHDGKLRATFLSSTNWFLLLRICLLISRNIVFHLLWLLNSHCFVRFFRLVWNKWSQLFRLDYEVYSWALAISKITKQRLYFNVFKLLRCYHSGFFRIRRCRFKSSYNKGPLFYLLFTLSLRLFSYHTEKRWGNKKKCECFMKWGEKTIWGVGTKLSLFFFSQYFSLAHHSSFTTSLYWNRFNLFSLSTFIRSLSWSSCSCFLGM